MRNIQATLGRKWAILTWQVAARGEVFWRRLCLLKLSLEELELVTGRREDRLIPSRRSSVNRGTQGRYMLFWNTNLELGPGEERGGRSTEQGSIAYRRRSLLCAFRQEMMGPVP